MSHTLGLLARGIGGAAAILSMLCIGGCVSVTATMPTDAEARSEQSAVAVVHAYQKASESGLINLQFGSPVREAESRRTFGRWWCTGKPTEIAVEELNQLLENNCQARGGRWRKHDAKTVWCEDVKGEGLLFLGVVGGYVWDSAALKDYTVPASQRRKLVCSETGDEHRDISAHLTEPASAPILDQAVARRFGYVPTVERYRKSFAEAKSAAQWESFLSDYANFDPDNLRATAQANLDAAKLREYRTAFQAIASTHDIEAFERRYAQDDPEGLVPKAMAMKTRLAKQERERNARDSRQTSTREIQAARANAGTNGRGLDLSDPTGVKACAVLSLGTRRIADESQARNVGARETRAYYELKDKVFEGNQDEVAGVVADFTDRMRGTLKPALIEAWSRKGFCLGWPDEVLFSPNVIQPLGKTCNPVPDTRSADCINAFANEIWERLSPHEKTRAQRILSELQSAE